MKVDSTSGGEFVALHCGGRPASAGRRAAWKAGLVLVLALAGGCQDDTETPEGYPPPTDGPYPISTDGATPTFTPTPIGRSTATATPTSTPDRPSPEPSGAAYVPNQLILAGHFGDIQEVVDLALPGAEPLDGIEPISVGPIGIGTPTPGSLPDVVARPVSPDGDFERPGRTAPNFAVQLYDVRGVEFDPAGEWEVDPDKTLLAIAAVYEEVRMLNQSPGGEAVVVVADPNYLVSNGSIFDPKDGPGGIGPHSVGTPTAQHLSITQWMWDEVTAPGEGSNGEGVDIVVLDTSPFGTGTHGIDWASTPFDIDVDASFGVPTVSVTPTPETLAQFKQHGLFVAGIAKAVAPGADLHLLRVLNDMGVGTLFEALSAMYGYLNTAPKTGLTLDTPTVFNLSLGLRCSEIPPLPTAVVGGIKSLATAVATEYPSVSTALATPPCPGSENVVTSMHAAIALAEALGAHVVAASGNNSATSVESSKVPAIFDSVISVTGTVKGGAERSCFANAGQVAAPAGGATPASPGPCVVTGLATACRDANGTPGVPPVGCDTALIGLVNPASFNGLTNEAEFSSGHAFWMGTSFAAPIVSGGLARIVQANAVVATDPDGAAQQLHCGTMGGIGTPQPLPTVDVTRPMGSGSIDLEVALDSACEP